MIKLHRPPDEQRTPDEGDVVLALDVGSTWCKAAYVDRSGQTVASGSSWVRDERPFGHDALALALIWNGVREAISNASRQLGGAPRPAAMAVAAMLTTTHTVDASAGFRSAYADLIASARLPIGTAPGDAVAGTGA